MVAYPLLSSLPPTGWTFQLMTSDEVAGERGGEMRVKQLGPDLWGARYEATQIRLRDVRPLKALIYSFTVQRGLFYGWDPRGQWPMTDPMGNKLTGYNNVRINSVNADNYRLSLKGLPAGYILAAGDYLAFNYNGNARALHQIWSPSVITANASGVTPEFYCAPKLRPFPSVDQPVYLKQPACEMLIVPGSFQVIEGPRTASIFFDAIQVLP